MMLSVEFRVDVTGMPHSFLVITGPDGVERGYGLVPSNEGTPQSPGRIQDDTSHPFDNTTGKIPLTQEEYNRLADFINQSIQNPPPYDVYFGSQCSTWAVKGLVDAGIPALASPNVFPDNFLRDLAETIVWNPYTQWLNLKIGDFFNAAQTWVMRYDPLTFDLDGDGLETIALSTSNPILFDLDGDGNKTATGWISPHDGFLALDRNGDGVINNGTELFGDATTLYTGGKAADGFAALAQEDTNADGKVDASDARFASLRIWRDLNSNGITDAGELKTLTESGIASINVTKTANSQILANGNQVADLGTYTKTDGTTATLGDTAQLGDVNLAQNTFISQFTDAIPLTVAAAALPNMNGSGMVRQLREAANDQEWREVA